jgi:hypothetical protein
MVERDPCWRVSGHTYISSQIRSCEMYVPDVLVTDFAPTNFWPEMALIFRTATEKNPTPECTELSEHESLEGMPTHPAR